MRASAPRWMAMIRCPAPTRARRFRSSDGAPGKYFPALDLQCMPAMRDYDEEDPKKPQPVRIPKKGSNSFEATEADPWRTIRKDIDRDRHRHL
jgi:hypothetical protein